LKERGQSLKFKVMMKAKKAGEPNEEIREKAFAMMMVHN
jgi:hypothetical protein